MKTGTIPESVVERLAPGPVPALALVDVDESGLAEVAASVAGARRPATRYG